MKTIQEVNPALAYLEGMLWAAFGVKVVSGNAVEWQIDALKEHAKALKDEEIDHLAVTNDEKEDQKRLWEQWIDETTEGFKEVIKKEGRME